MVNIGKEFLLLEQGLSIKVENWENIKNFIASLWQKNEELRKSRDNWKEKYMELKHAKKG